MTQESDQFSTQTSTSEEAGWQLSWPSPRSPPLENPRLRSAWLWRFETRLVGARDASRTNLRAWSCPGVVEIVARLEFGTCVAEETQKGN